jgi:phosphomannomutase
MVDQAPLMLSVSGLRGLIGKSLTPPVAARYAAAVGQWFKGQTTGAPHVVVGRDSRPSGEMLEAIVSAGLVAVGCKVTRLGIVTTPSVAVMANHLNATGGIVITASHNPIIWNGIKTLMHNGSAPPAAEAEKIIQMFHDDAVRYAPVEALQTIGHETRTNDVHVARVLKLVDIDAIRKAKLKAVLDSVHGAGGPAARLLLDALGVELVHLFGEPTGQFPHTPEPTKENLVGLCDAMKQHNAHVGFAQDPDADRLAIVDEQGTYIGEEYTLALCALHLLARSDKAKGAVLVANLSTSRMIDDIAASHGATVVRTAVGEANVTEAMRQHDALAGGEGNGGIIHPDVVFVRDSLTGMALTLEMLAKRGKPLSSIVGEVPSYVILKDKVDLAPGMKEQIPAKMRLAFGKQKLDEQDGVRVDWPDKWVHVRASNTEPIMRLIAEASTPAAAKDLIAQARAAMGLK